MTRKIGAALAVLLILSLTPAWAGRPDKDWKNWFGHVGMGWSIPQGDASDILDDDLYFNGGATYWPTTFPVGIDLDLSYSNYDVSNKAINAINDALEADGQERSVTGGDADIWSLTVNGIWSPGKGRTGFHVTAGVGAYYTDWQLNTTGLVYYPPICDPYWWWCYPGGVGPGSIPIASDSNTDFGWNVGIGIDFEVGSTGSQVYVEGKYHSVDVGKGSLEYIPIVVGYRW